jgi:hypothetical protein
VSYHPLVSLHASDDQPRPIEASVVLLPLFEFIHVNPTFSSVMLEPISKLDEKNQSDLPSSPAFSILTLSSYLLSHASSAFSPRSVAYANLSLKILLAFVENDEVMTQFCQPTQCHIRLCRQVRSYRVILLDSINQLSMEEIALARGLVPSTTTNLRYFGLLCTMATPQPT